MLIRTTLTHNFKLMSTRPHNLTAATKHRANHIEKIALLDLVENFAENTFRIDEMRERLRHEVFQGMVNCTTKGSLISTHHAEFVAFTMKEWALGLAVHIDQPEEPRLDAATFHTMPRGKALLSGGSEAPVRGGTTAFYTGEVAD